MAKDPKDNETLDMLVQPGKADEVMRECARVLETAALWGGSVNVVDDSVIVEGTPEFCKEQLAKYRQQFDEMGKALLTKTRRSGAYTQFQNIPRER